MEVILDKNAKIELILEDIVGKLSIFKFVEKIILFGSRARNDAEIRSDIDLAILCPQASDREWLQVCEIIEKIETLLKIDLVRIDSASQELQQRVFAEGKVLYEKNV